MLELVADNLYTTLILLGIVAFILGAVWWNTRKKWWLVGCLATVALMVVVFAVSWFTVTDRMQLSNNVDGMRNAINAGKVEDAMQYFEDKVTVETAIGGGKVVEVSKADLLKFAKNNMRHYSVQKVITGPVHVDDLKKPDAVVRFAVRNEEGDKSGWCTMKFRYADGKWRVKEFTVESLIGGQKAPVLFPF